MTRNERAIWEEIKRTGRSLASFEEYPPFEEYSSYEEWKEEQNEEFEAWKKWLKSLNHSQLLKLQKYVNIPSDKTEILLNFNKNSKKDQNFLVQTLLRTYGKNYEFLSWLNSKEKGVFI